MAEALDQQFADFSRAAKFAYCRYALAASVHSIETCLALM
ncbi:hypothetical protein MES4922_120012 [Mesorhizobium ventifaucium]|uniref:HEPN domain-containing protein n=1 Tax=Mesorhizobium ventifaucium TaxID=666020 RepID=A0ABN8JBI9_9HYPH|nr:hypothetical protein MES4922_120012 [Mesorhizobium ventifaucium]